LDTKAYQGKVVLVSFWTTSSPECEPELTNTKRTYSLYHDRGFEVVTVSLDEDRQELEQYLENDPLPWDIVYTDGAGWEDPMAVHYGISSVPTMFLVGQDGKVVSTQARSQNLDQLLQRLLGPPYVLHGRLSYIDVEAKANQKLADGVFNNAPTDNLADLPTGEQTFGGVKFRIGDSFIHLGGKIARNKPKEVKGIQVNSSFVSLYILHGTRLAQDHKHIGDYQVNYDDGTEGTIPIVCGEDLRDWWNIDESSPVSRGTVVWEGSNAMTKSKDLTLRLYLTKWTNPHPEKQVASIDYISANTGAAPFCVAMTIEQQADTPSTDPVSVGD